MAKADGTPTFEDALAQLETIVTSIEQGKTGLQESIAQYEKGMKLIQYCRSVLTDAEGKIQQLQLGQAGTLETRAFEAPGADAPG